MISAAVRIMMSRLTLSMRISFARANSVPLAMSSLPPRQAMRDQDAEHEAGRFRDHRGDGGPGNAGVKHQHQRAPSPPALTRLIAICVASASSARACADQPAEHDVIGEHQRRRPDPDRGR